MKKNSFLTFTPAIGLMLILALSKPAFAVILFSEDILSIDGPGITLDAHNTTSEGEDVTITANQGIDLPGIIKYDSEDNVWKLSNNGENFAEILTSDSPKENLDKAYDNFGANPSVIDIDANEGQVGSLKFNSTLNFDPALSIVNSGNGGTLTVDNYGFGNSFRVKDEVNDTTPFIIDDEGNVGIGTEAPTNKLHVWSDEDNYIVVDGESDADKGIRFSDEGETKWEQYIWKNEDGRFFYTYNDEAQKDIWVLTEDGRFGFNKQSNIMNDHSCYTGTGTNNMIVDGIFDQDVQTNYQLVINGDGTPNTFQWRTSTDGANYDAFSETTEITGELQYLSHGISVQFEDLGGHAIGDRWDFVAFPQSPTATFSIASNMFDEVLTTTDNTTFSNWTYAANTTMEKLFTMETGSGEYTYFGSETKFPSIFINTSIPAVGVTTKAEYYNGTSWQTLGPANDFVDGTANLTKNGSLLWNLSTMLDWSSNIVIDENADLYWVRVSSTTTPTTEPQVGVINHTEKKFSLFAGFLDPYPSFFINSLGSTSIGGGNITGSNLLQINSKGNQNTTTSYNSSILEIDSENGLKSDFNYRLSTDDTTHHPATLYSRSRGTLSSPTVVTNGTTIGGNYFIGYDSDSWEIAASIVAKIDGGAGNGDTPGALYFNTTPDGSASPLTRLTIKNTGNIGVGTTSPDFKLDISGGSARLEGTNRLYFGGTGSSDTNGNLYHNGIDFIFTDTVQVNNGSNTVYKCATEGVLPVGTLTTNSASCGSVIDTGLRIN